MPGHPLHGHHAEVDGDGVVKVFCRHGVRHPPVFPADERHTCDGCCRAEEATDLRSAVEQEAVVDAKLGRVICPHRQVAIIGAGPGRERAPYGDPAWCTWALNEIPQRAWTRHFELHPMSVQSERDLDILARQDAPCYVLELDARVRHAVRYPLERVRAAGFRDYFTCTFAYQIALALTDGFEVIGLWGLSLSRGTGRERLVERACVEYWLGVAEGRGVRIVEDSGLARQPYLYGYDYHEEMEEIRLECDAVAHVIREEQSRRGNAVAAMSGSTQAQVDAIGERVILGSLLTGVAANLLGTLAPEDFTGQAHRAVFAAMVDLNGRNEPLTVPALIEVLTQRGELDVAGGASGLAGLIKDASIRGVAANSAALLMMSTASAAVETSP